MAVNGKQKGGEFERSVCKQLSLWVSDGARQDLFWRSAMSGGRATVSRGQVRQAGDISAVAPEGHVLTDKYYIECKHYKDLQVRSFILDQKGSLALFWQKAVLEAVKYGTTPWLIAKQNLLPTLLLSPAPGFELPRVMPAHVLAIVRTERGCCYIRRLGDVLSGPFSQFKE